MHKSLFISLLIFTASLMTSFESQAEGNLSGTYDVGTLTPLQRPEAYGNNLFLTEEEAAVYAQRIQARVAQDAADSDPNRDAPEKGGNVGGYNFFWLDVGTGAASVDGKFRTSIITTPANGRIPAMTPYGAARLKGFLDNWQIIWRSPDPTASKNSGEAWWLEEESGPYDNLEQRPLAERCIIGSRSTAGPPMLPNIYNNHKRIIQTPDHIMILTEMNHDARVIRMNATHRPDNIRTWLGDSIGYWEGETLVIKTKNFKQTPALSGADENLEVTEYLSRTDDGGLLYRFEVNNPEIWTQPWGGEYPWAAADGKVYEVACHEGNYALGNIMRGARVLEADARAAEPEPAG